MKEGSGHSVVLFVCLFVCFVSLRWRRIVVSDRNPSEYSVQSKGETVTISMIEKRREKTGQSESAQSSLVREDRRHSTPQRT